MVAESVGLADLEVPRHLHQSVADLVEHAAVHHGPGGRGADLSRVEGPRRADAPDRPLHVGVLEDDAGTLAAELEQRALHCPGGLLGDDVDPRWVEPVKLTQSTSSASTSAAAAAGPFPFTRFTTPGGTPTSLRMRTSSTMARGSCGVGLTMKLLPAASAGATLPAMFTIGKLYDVMHATTPRGWRLTMAPMIPPGASGVACAGLGDERRLQHGAGIAGVALEAVCRHGHLHARADGRRGPRLGDHERQQLRGLGPDGGRGLAHEGAALVGRPGRPARLGLLGRRGGGQGVVRAGVGGQPDDLLGGGVDDLVGPV